MLATYETIQKLLRVACAIAKIDPADVQGADDDATLGPLTDDYIQDYHRVLIEEFNRKKRGR